MAKIIENSTKTVIKENVENSEAIEFVENLYREKGLDRQKTDKTIHCGYAIRSLVQYEVEHLLSLYPTIFKDSKFDDDYKAYRVTSEQFDAFKKTNTRYIIVQDA